MGKKILEKLYLILQVILILIWMIILCNGIFYFIGLLITGNIDFREWWIIKTNVGNIFLVLIELSILFGFPSVIKESIKK